MSVEKFSHCTKIRHDRELLRLAGDAEIHRSHYQRHQSFYFSYMAIQLKDTVTASAGFQKGIVAENAEAMSKTAEIGKNYRLYRE